MNIDRIQKDGESLIRVIEGELSKSLSQRESGRSDAELTWLKNEIMRMVTSAQSVEKGQVVRVDAVLSRKVLDEWPLGSSLGNQVVEFEHEWKEVIEAMM